MKFTNDTNGYSLQFDSATEQSFTARLLKQREAINTDDELAARVGAKLAEVLDLRRDRRVRERWRTTWGNKTDAGIARTVLRILDEARE